MKYVFETRCSTGREKDAQLCVYVGDEKVVDLWGSPNEAYSADTLTTVFSRQVQLYPIVSCSF